MEKKDFMNSSNSACRWQCKSRYKAEEEWLKDKYILCVLVFLYVCDVGVCLSGLAHLCGSSVWFLPAGYTTAHWEFWVLLL